MMPLGKLHQYRPVQKLICNTFLSAESSLLKEFKGNDLYLFFFFVIVSFTCIIIRTAHISDKT